jgi:hypothetical protein
MGLQIDTVDRILNLTPPTSTDKTLLNADNVMLMLDKMVNGDYRYKLKGGLESSKPSTPEDREVYMVLETSYFAFEVYTTSFGWLILKGVWLNSASRPSTTGLAVGSEGYNVNDSTREFWDGSEWRII